MLFCEIFSLLSQNFNNFCDHKIFNAPTSTYSNCSHVIYLPVSWATASHILTPYVPDKKHFVSFLFPARKLSKRVLLTVSVENVPNARGRPVPLVSQRKLVRDGRQAQFWQRQWPNFPTPALTLDGLREGFSLALNRCFQTQCTWRNFRNTCFETLTIINLNYTALAHKGPG